MLAFARIAFLAVILLREKCHTETLEENDGETSRIVNGTEAVPGQFPFAVYMKNLFYNGSYSYACTLSLITTKTCLGAAHCVFQDDRVTLIPAEKFCGVVGTIDRMEEGNCHQFSKIFVHEDYYHRLVLNDIATFVFAEEMELDGNFLDVVPLIAGDALIDETSVTAIGWGKLFHRGDSSEPRYLRYVNLELPPKEECYTTVKKLCVLSEGKGICNGDSGGPNVITRAGKHIEIGISSYVIFDCALKYSFLTAIQPFTEWIKEHSVGDPIFVSG